jgi:FkbM family methyltransferase
MANTKKSPMRTHDAPESTRRDADQGKVAANPTVSRSGSAALGVVLYVVGRCADADHHPNLRDFPLLNREAGESEAAHLVRVAGMVDAALAAGGTHLQVPREHADWLGDHSLVLDYFAEYHDLAEADAGTGIVFKLRRPGSVAFTSEVGWSDCATRDDFMIASALASRHVVAPAGPDTGDLTRFEFKLFSQNGEDGVLAEIFRRIGTGGRFFVEIGADLWESNALALADVLGWSGVFIEANPEKAEAFRYKYAGVTGITAVEGIVTPDSINTLLASANVPVDVDLLSIDIDGNDFWVWAALERCQPRVVVIEYNAHLKSEAQLVQPYSNEGVYEYTNYFGASIGALLALGERIGYRLVHTESHGVNAFFVRTDLLPYFSDLRLDAVPLRKPNYDGRGQSHPVDYSGRIYLSLNQENAKFGDFNEQRAQLASSELQNLVRDGRGMPRVDPTWIRTDDTDVGIMFTDPTDCVIGAWVRNSKTWEPEVNMFVRHEVRRGMNIVDVGANIGYCTLLFSQLVGPKGQVLAIEPEPRNVQLLEANVCANIVQNVAILPVGVARTCQVLTMYLDSHGNWGNHLAYSTGTATETVDVSAWPLDDLLDPDTPVHFVKVDIQGMDHVAVASMQQTIRRWSPTVMVEFQPSSIHAYGDDPLKVLMDYRNLGFAITALGEDNPIPAGGEATFIESMQGVMWRDLILRPVTQSPQR